MLIGKTDLMSLVYPQRDSGVYVRKTISIRSYTNITCQEFYLKMNRRFIFNTIFYKIGELLWRKAFISTINKNELF